MADVSAKIKQLNIEFDDTNISANANIVSGHDIKESFAIIHKRLSNITSDVYGLSNEISANTNLDTVGIGMWYCTATNATSLTNCPITTETAFTMYCLYNAYNVRYTQIIIPQGSSTCSSIYVRGNSSVGWGSWFNFNGSYDTEPTSESTNLLTSGSIYTALQNVPQGTVTSVSAGVGLATASGSAITSAGTIKAKLKQETASTLDSGNVTSTNNRQYAVIPDKSGYLSVNVPWSDSNTVSTAYCNTGATTAAKTATCTNYVLRANSFIHVLITTTNTYPAAITLNINNTGAKVICIDGTPTSDSNYTLNAGTYLVYYDGTYYYFNTQGKIECSGILDVNKNTTKFARGDGTFVDLSASAVGGDGKYIKSISQSGGIISATSETMDTTPTSGSTKAITSGAVYTAIQNVPKGTVTSVGIVNGGALSVSGSPITGSGSITISHADTSSQSSIPGADRILIKGVTLDDYGHITALSTFTSPGIHTQGASYTYNDETYYGYSSDEIFNDYITNRAAGTYSHAEGTGTSALERGCHAEGSNTVAVGNYAHAEGGTTIASGNISHAEGTNTIASADYQHVQGKYNVAQEDLSTQMSFIIGNGDSTTRSNALSVDWSGNLYINNDTEGVDVRLLKCTPLIAFGTCSTAAGTKDKVVSITNTTWIRRIGSIVYVKYSATNTYSATASNHITLNVNGTGAADIYYNNSNANTGTNTNAYGYANRYTAYIWNGTYWVWLSQGIDNNTTYSTITQAEIEAGTGTGTRVVTPALLKYAIDNWILHSTTALANGDDLNNITTLGVYRAATTTIANSISHRPNYSDPTLKAFRLEVTDGSGTSDRQMQKLYVFNVNTGAVEEFFRFHTSSGWGSWYQAALSAVSDYVPT